MRNSQWVIVKPLILLLLVYCFPCLSLAGNPGRAGKRYEIQPQLRMKQQMSRLIANWEKLFGVPRKILYPPRSTYSGSPREIAQHFLDNNLRLSAKIGRRAPELYYRHSRTSRGAEHLYYQQTYQGVPVYSGGATVHITRKNRQILMVDNSVYPDIDLADVRPSLAAEEALAILKAEIGFSGELLDEENARLVIYPTIDGYYLAWQVEVPAASPYGLWEAFIDAHSGAILAMRDKIVHHRPQSTGGSTARSLSTEGLGRVFNPNPVVALQNDLLEDQDDADAAVPEPAYTTVTLPDITFDQDRGVYTLTGPYVNITQRESPVNTPATSADGNFMFSRDADEFEDVMCYYHIDAFRRYVENVLGHNLTGTIADELDVDSNGQLGDDNSAFVPSVNPYLSYGHGGVDDAEDAEIVIHEYGHALHYAVVGGIGGTFQNISFSEGFSDVLAFGWFMVNGASNGYHDEFIGDWDATSYSDSLPPYLRRVDGLGFPEGQPFTPARCTEEHDCGEFWSAACWELSQAIGVENMLRVVIGGLYYQTAFDDYQDIVLSVILADRAINDGAHVSAILSAMENWGLIDETAVLPVIEHLPLADTEDTAGPYPVTAKVIPVISPVNPNSVRLHFSNDRSFSNSVQMILTGNPDEYRAEIPSQGSDLRIYYYISAEDVNGKRITAPKTAPVAQFSFIAGVLNTTTITRSVNLPIPDADPEGISDVFNITELPGSNIIDIDLIFKAQHSWFGDLIVTVTSPDGRQAVLIDRPGDPAVDLGSEGKDPDIILDDEALISIENVSVGAQQVSGRFQPFPDPISILKGGNYLGNWTISVSDNASEDTGTLLEWGFIFTIGADEGESLPQEFALHQNYPNPFNPATTIGYDLPRNVRVSLKVFNILGQEIRTLVDEEQTAGFKEVMWDGSDNFGNPAASGVYVYRLKAGEFIQSRKMVRLR